MYLPTLCGLRAFGLKSEQASEKTKESKSSLFAPKGQKLVRQNVNLRSLQSIIQQAVNEVERDEVKIANQGPK